jgi:hypothetical protein
MPLKCFSFKNKSVQQRFQLANDKKLCKLCLFSNHTTSACKKKDMFKCTICSKPHNTLLHLNINNTNNTKPKPTVKFILRTRTEFPRIDQPTPIAHLLQAKIVSESGQSQLITILMDSGSSMNLITSKLMRDLQLPTIDVRGPQTCELLGGIKKHLCQRQVQFELHALHSDYKCKMRASVINNIGEDNTDMNFDHNTYPHLSQYKLTIPLPKRETLTISVLVGEPAYSALFLGLDARCTCNNNNECIAVYSSKLGYYLGGSFSSYATQRRDHFLTLTSNIPRES